MDCGLCCGLAECDCGAEPSGKYRVLNPIYEKTGESGTDSDGKVVRWNRVKEWGHLGYADSMADALAKFPRCKRNGYSPVLEYCGALH
jgi:hypothetical protein